MIAAPLFHSWGFFHFVDQPADRLDDRAAAPLRPRGDAAGGRRTTAPRCSRVVPVMLQRILQLPEETLDAYDLSSLRITSLSGSALPGELATEWMDRFGDNVYNLYGSTEVAYATVATPEDLRAAPGTAGRPPRGTVGRALRRGRAGGADRARSGGSSSATRCRSRATPAAAARRRSTACSAAATSATSTPTGRLFIDGRDDEMIVSGGENVFPREVEDLLADHEAVVEVAVIGVEDEEFGQRLKAFVVARDGRRGRRGRAQGPRQGEPRRLQGAARDRVPRRAAAQRDRQGPQARAARARGRAARPEAATTSANCGISAADGWRAFRRP